MKIRRILICAALTVMLLATCITIPVGGASISNTYRLGNNWVLETVYEMSRDALAASTAGKTFTFGPAGDISDADYIAVRVKTGANAVGAAATHLVGSANYKGVHLNQGLLITLDGEISELTANSHNYSGIPANFDGYVLFTLAKCICAGGGNGVRRDDCIKRLEPYDLADDAYGVDLKHIKSFTFGLPAGTEGVSVGGAAAVKLVSKRGNASVQYGNEMPGISVALTDGYFTHNGSGDKFIGCLNTGATADISSYRYMAFPVKTTAEAKAVQFFFKMTVGEDENWDISFNTGKLVSADGTVKDITKNASSTWLIDIPANFDGLVLVDLNNGVGKGGVAVSRVGDEIRETASQAVRANLVNGIAKVYVKAKSGTSISVGNAFPANLTVDTNKFVYGDYTMNVVNDLPGEWTNNGNQKYEGTFQVAKATGTTNFASGLGNVKVDFTDANYMAFRVKNTGTATAATSTLKLTTSNGTENYTTGVYLSNGFALSLDGKLVRLLPAASGYQFGVPANFDGYLLFQLDTAVGYNLSGHKVQSIGDKYYDVSDRTKTDAVSDRSKVVRYDLNLTTEATNSAVYVGEFYGVTLDIDVENIDLKNTTPMWTSTVRTFNGEGLLEVPFGTSTSHMYYDNNFVASDITDGDKIIIRLKNGDQEIPAGGHAYMRSEDAAKYGSGSAGCIYLNHGSLVDLNGNVTPLTGGDYNWKAIHANFDGYIVFDISEGKTFTPSGGGTGAKRIGNGIKMTAANGNFTEGTVVTNLEKFNHLRLAFKKNGNADQKIYVGFIGYSNLSEKAAVKTEALPVPADPTLTLSENLTLGFGDYTDKSVAVNVNAAEGYTYTYQWYVSATADAAADGTVIEGATASSYAIPNDEAIGTKYYYCVVKATVTGGRETAVEIGNKISVTVGKGTPDVTAPTAKTDLTYTGERQGLINEGTVTGGTFMYSHDGNTWTDQLPGGTSAGSYTVYYKVVGDANHNDVAGGTITITIAKANATVTAPEAVEDLVADGTAKALITAGTANGGAIQYKLGDGEWGTEIPTATEAGTYTVYYKVVGDANHNDVQQASVSVTISAPAPTPTPTPVATPTPTPVATPTPTPEATPTPTPVETTPAPTAEPTTPPTANPETGAVSVMALVAVAVVSGTGLVISRKKRA